MLQAGKAVAMPLSSTATTVITSSDSHDSLGLFLAWGGTVLYCLSRCPQLYKTTNENLLKAFHRCYLVLLY